MDSYQNEGRYTNEGPYVGYGDSDDVRSSIEGQLRVTDKRISELGEVIKVLTDRVTPVLRGETPRIDASMITGENMKSPVPDSPLYKFVQDQQVQIDRLTNTLRDLIERVQL